jgi:glycosyltransferase involved in cell wall biosynthesis
MSWAGLATDLPARLGAVPGVLAWAAIPYILAHIRRRAAFLSQADAVIAVSRYVARRLEAVVSTERIQVIPNMVDHLATERIAATPPETPLPGRFLLFVGKLEQNKGAGFLVPIFRVLQRVFASGTKVPCTLVVAGSGALRADIERDLAKLGVPTRFLAWAPHDEVLRLMARCELLLFPSAWGEPLSRVLLEASMLGAPILAMPTGGTPDIITDGVNGALAATPEAFARRLALLLRSPEERRRLGDQARRLARQRFAVEVVAPQVEELYDRVLQGKHGK